MKVTLLDTKTGERLEATEPFADFNPYWWQDGNGSCDCNRELAFGNDDLEDCICMGAHRYLVVDFELTESEKSELRPGFSYTLLDFNSDYPKELLLQHNITTAEEIDALWTACSLRNHLKPGEPIEEMMPCNHILGLLQPGCYECSGEQPVYLSEVTTLDFDRFAFCPLCGQNLATLNIQDFIKPSEPPKPRSEFEERIHKAFYSEMPTIESITEIRLKDAGFINEVQIKDSPPPSALSADV